MRVPNPRLIRIGGLSGGAILENDSELVIPPVLQPGVELPGPINSLPGLPVGTQNDSFAANSQSLVAGAFAGQNFLLATMSRGLWKLSFTFQAQFTGTTNAAAFDALQIRDPDANNHPIFLFSHITGQFIADGIDQWWLFQRDGFAVRYFQSATIAGDNLALNMSVIGTRYA
jgi:hypothetical protein